MYVGDGRCSFKYIPNSPNTWVDVEKSQDNVSNRPAKIKALKLPPLDEKGQFTPCLKNAAYLIFYNLSNCNQ